MNENPLRQHWLFAELPQEEIGRTIDAIQSVRFTEGDILLRQGEPSLGVYLISEGSLRVSTENQMGQMFLGLVKSGELLGELGVLDGEPRSATTIAMGSGQAYFVPADTFLHVLEISSRASFQLVLLLASRLRQTNERMMQLAPAAGPVQRRTMPIAP